MKLDEEGPDRVEDYDRGASQQSSNNRNNNSWVARQPVPDAVSLDSFNIRQSQESSSLAATHGLFDNESVHAVSRYDGVT